MTDLKIAVEDFNKALQKHYDKVVKKDAREILIGIAIQAVGEFARLTPVDTGRARAGWYPAMRTLKIPAGAGDEGSIEMNFSGDNPYIEINNRVHYVIYLEYGHSKQAPQGMVRRTLTKMQAVIDKESR